MRERNWRRSRAGRRSGSVWRWPTAAAAPAARADVQRTSLPGPARHRLSPAPLHIAIDRSSGHTALPSGAASGEQRRTRPTTRCSHVAPQAPHPRAKDAGPQPGPHWPQLRPRWREWRRRRCRPRCPPPGARASEPRPAAFWGACGAGKLPEACLEPGPTVLACCVPLPLLQGLFSQFRGLRGAAALPGTSAAPSPLAQLRRSMAAAQRQQAARVAAVAAPAEVASKPAPKEAHGFKLVEEQYVAEYGSQARFFPACCVGLHCSVQAEVQPAAEP